MIVFNKMLQGSEEWQKARMGRATASEASNILTPKGKLSASRVKYMRKLARECVCDDPLEWTGNRYTDWGHDLEEEARLRFERETGFAVETVGLCTRDDGIIGFSPDGLIYDGPIPFEGVEFKCPAPDTHVNYLMEGVLPDDYKLQIHWSLAASDLPSWWFMSYFPGLNPLILKIDRDEFTETVKEAQDQFLIDYAEERKRVFEKILPKKKEEEGGLI